MSVRCILRAKVRIQRRSTLHPKAKPRVATENGG